MAAGQNDGFNYVAQNVGNFQAANGAFSAREGAETGDLKSTAEATLLVGLHGLGSKISVAAVGNYLNELENSDGGYGATSDSSSTIQATLDAVTSLRNLELPFSDAAKTAAYVRSLFESSTGLFGSGQGGKGDAKSTAHALIVLDTLGQLQSASSLFPAIRDALARFVRGGDHFAFPSDRVSGEATYWGVIAGSLCGFDFGARSKWVARFESLASASGAIAAVEGAAGSLETTSQALHAIFLLNDAKIGDALATSASRYATEETTRSLRSASQAHVIALLSGSIKKSYNIGVFLERADGSPLPAQIVQGTSFRTVVRVDSVFGVGGAATVSSVIQHGADSVATEKLPFNAERKVFVSSDLFDTDGKLGAVKFSFAVQRNVAPFPSLKLETKTERSIGFGINVQASAKHAEKEVAEGDTVSVGTEFSFDVSLYRSDRKRFVAGDFDVSMIVRDASKAELSREKLSGKAATELLFSYTLSKSNLPPPRILFDFEVSSNGVVHTFHETSYTLATLAVATDIKIGHKSVQIGQTETISFQPAAFPDKLKVQPFDFQESRQFFLDLRSSVTGAVTRSIKGTTAKSGVSFSVDLPASLESVGTHFIAFRFLASDGSSVGLTPHDAVHGDIIENPTLLNFTVAAKLAVADATLPAAGDFFYGNEVSFDFKLKDLVSGKLLSRGAGDESNVFLSLRHSQDGSNEFTSATVPATFAADVFSIRWKITPNAVRGKGSLVLTAGQDQPVHDADGNRALRLEVNVGGEIDIVKKVYTTDNPDTSKSVILVTFSLTCRGQALDNAELYANLRRGSAMVARDLQVSSAVGGQYEVSFAGAHKTVTEGRYVFDIYRVTDRARVHESKGAIKLEPLLSVDIEHEGVASGSDLGVDPGFIVVALLLISTVFVIFSQQKLLSK